MSTGTTAQADQQLRPPEELDDVQMRSLAVVEAPAPLPREPAVTWIPVPVLCALAVVFLPGGHPLQPALAGAAVLAFIAAEQVKLPLTVGSANGLQTLGYASTLQPAFVLMVFAFPLNVVPAVALACMVISSLVRNRSLAYLTTAVADSWFAITPTVVLALLAPGPASWSRWPLYACAFGAEFLADMLVGAVRRALHHDPVSDPTTVLLPLTIDILLTPVGLAAAVIGNTEPAPAVVLLAGVIGVMALLGRERAHRIRESHRALHDPLTGVANRLLFFELLDAAARRCERTNTEGALLLIDLDNFKAVNDTHGHGRGDQVLCMFAERVRCTIRESDTVARLGGDEFAVLLEDPAERGAAEVVADKLRAAFTTPLLLPDGATLKVGASIGAAMFAADAPLAHALAAADRALYADKRRAVMLRA
jgi:diguanylate cyclase (GGDEF)-like protein